MPQHDQTTCKEHYYDWYKHSNNIATTNVVKNVWFLLNSVKITKIRTMG